MVSKKRTTNGDYEIGRNKPPKHTQFKPGQSGNPSGRRRSSRQIEELLREKGERLVTVTTSGRTRQIAQIDLLLELLFQKATRGDLAAIRYLLDRYPRVDIRAEQSPLLVRAPDGKGTRTVSFEVTEEEVALIEGIRDDLGKYYNPDFALED